MVSFVYQKINTKNLHPYRTRSQAGFMDALEQNQQAMQQTQQAIQQDQQAMRGELDQMSVQMNKMFDLLKALDEKMTPETEQFVEDFIQNHQEESQPREDEIPVHTPQRQAPLNNGTPRNTSTQNFIPIITPQEDAQAKEKFRMFEDRLKAIEGADHIGFEASDMCLVPDVVVPAKFKVPEFDKYKGETCPKSHLVMYCRKMASFSNDDRLLIHFFQESLTGAPLRWYMQLERSKIRSWKDLANAFVKQYKYNMDMAPSRNQLQSMKKKDSESYKEYAQRWRSMAAQVEPPLLDKEMIDTFIGTLQSPFYDMMIGSMFSNFSDLIVIGERVEMGMQSGKIHNNTSSSGNQKSFIKKKKEGETNAVSTAPLYVAAATTPMSPAQMTPFASDNQGGQNSYL